MFWRPANEVSARHRSPLFSDAACRMEVTAVDGLHVMNEGVYKDYCRDTCWQLIEHDAFNTLATTAPIRQEHNCAQLSVELKKWYRRMKEDVPDNRLYEIQELRSTMLGSRTAPTLHTKAVETGTFLEFCRDIARERVASLGEEGPAVVALGDCLVRLRDIWRKGNRHLTLELQAESVQCATRALALRTHAHVTFHPKWHLMLEMVAQSSSKGNPQFYTTFRDEHFNGILADVAASCHRMTWHRGVLANFRWAKRAVRSRTDKD
eukprot:NODE_18254_length_902_cov_4.523871.p1 GENE.NODE_18254_length_902_cov_4.523871~~NODE_18254_length_902_cov_4.523871.p1  ORF type:complete len:293 (-),score=38.46 NODE_18254_length_902_cov_4.523871:24-815(-)